MNHEMNDKLKAIAMMAQMTNPNDLAVIISNAVKMTMVTTQGRIIDFMKGGVYTYQVYDMQDGTFMTVKESVLGGNPTKMRFETSMTQREAEDLMDKWYDEEMGATK